LFKFISLLQLQFIQLHLQNL